MIGPEKRSATRGSSHPKRRAFYLTAIVTLCVAAAGLFTLAYPTGTVVEAQTARTDIITSELTPRPDRLAIALDFRSAHNVPVYGGSGMNAGGATIRGVSAETAAVTKDKVRIDLDRAMKIIRQLDCTKIEDKDLTGRSIAPGVYCLQSMQLAGQLTLDGIGDQNAHFVFVVKGRLSVESGTRIVHQNGAAAQNVYFAVQQSVAVADGVAFGGTILARDNITIGAGSDVNGRVWSIDGSVMTSGESTMGNGTGILEICKYEASRAEGVGALANRVFRFQIGASTYQTPVGSCTGPIELAVGNVVITELDSGPIIGGGTWTGRFELIEVNSPTPNALGAVNLPARTANVFIREGSISNLTRVNFVNEFAITGTIEICKRTLDVDVSGFFDYTIDALPGTTFSVPAGYCSPPISVLQVALGQPEPPPAGSTTIWVTELTRLGFQLESTSTFPASRLGTFLINEGVFNTPACSNIGPYTTPPGCLFANAGGGAQALEIYEGGAGNQTTVNFFNRTRPGQVKVCKVAGPGIPENMMFRFTVTGTGPSNAFPQTQTPGVPIVRTVDVPAGPAIQGGYCNYVDGLFIIGTPVTVTEQTGNIGGPQPNLGGTPPGEVRVGRIRVNQVVQTSGSTTESNQAFLDSRSVTFTARREIVEAEFVNYVFRPTALKVCKTAGPGIAVGTPYAFTISIDNEGGLFAPSTSIAVENITVLAGTCVFVQGPYRPFIFTNPNIGAFRNTSKIYVTEAPAAGTVVTAITSLTGTVGACTPPSSRCGSLVLANPGGFNEIDFTNSTSHGPEGEAAFDFDGDGRTDVSTTRMGGTSTWYQLVGEGHNYVEFTLGQNDDILVPADYDGDGKTQPAVFRPSTANWWVMSDDEAAAVAVSAGAAGDIPLPSDYTGDGKADFVLFRPSTSQWLRYANGSTETSHMVFGTTGDKPLMGDFDGDGKSDPAVFRPSTGTFWYASSVDGSFKATQWGISSDIPAPADFDGDGKTDVAIFRPSNGTWWILNSSTGSLTGAQWGGNGDKPMIGDWDGDGKADIAVYRASNGTWYIVKSSGGFQGYEWGVPSDIATPTVYVP